MKKFWPLVRILPEKTSFEFVRFAKFAAILSVVLVIASIAKTVIPFEPPCGGLNCGVDFKGGTVLEVGLPDRSVDVGQVRGVLSGLGLGDVAVQESRGAAGSEQVHVHAVARFDPTGQASATQAVDQAKAALTAELGEGVFFPRTDVVGPQVSGELLRGGILALGLAIVLMLVYVWFRFELQFGMGAVVALFHDVILTFGLFAFTGLEFTLTTVAALLTIIGYSMNDTVVVFDRLRENLRKYKKMPLGEVIDLSINETLTRTINTGLTTLVALIALALLGGDALYGFAVALAFGVIIGTYSSIYVAAPVILLWGVRRGDEDDLEPIDLSKGTRSARP